MPPEARERWLESLPAADCAYKEELRTLLRHGSAGETRDFLDILPNLREAVDNARAAVSVMPLRPGAAVGPYVVEREIGSGGMGAVWLARRSDGLIKRPVALKLPHPGPHGRHQERPDERCRDLWQEAVSVSLDSRRPCFRRSVGIERCARIAHSSHATGTPINQRENAGFSWAVLFVAAPEPCGIGPEPTKRTWLFNWPRIVRDSIPPLWSHSVGVPQLANSMT